MAEAVTPKLAYVATLLPGGCSLPCAYVLSNVKHCEPGIKILSLHLIHAGWAMAQPLLRVVGAQGGGAPRARGCVRTQRAECWVMPATGLTSETKTHARDEGCGEGCWGAAAREYARRKTGGGRGAAGKEGCGVSA